MTMVVMERGVLTGTHDTFDVHHAGVPMVEGCDLEDVSNQHQLPDHEQQRFGAAAVEAKEMQVHAIARERRINDNISIP